MEVWTDFPERIKPGSRLFLGEDHTEITVTAIRSKDRLLLLTLQGYDERDIVNSLRNQIVYTQTKNLPKLPQGQYYHHELVGLQVIDENGEDIGVIKAILETGANDVFVIDNQGKEILIPFIKSVILSIDQSAGFVKVKLPRWS